MNTKNGLSYLSPQALSSMPKDVPVLVAFSGGADSSALLHLIVNDSKMNGYSVHAAHFHHGIRGDEADRDAEFCRSVAEKYGIPFHIEQADIPALAKANGNSVEAEARERRYAFFDRVMRENGIPILVTAHHAEDQVESILLHVLRGSGISGLCGMKECRALSDGLYLVRPILNSEKSEILDYCHKNDIEFVIDSTNADTNYARNALRAEITPRLRELQPNISAVFARLAQSAAEADEFINAAALDFIEKECQGGIPTEKFNLLFAAPKSRVLSMLFERESGATLERVHIESLTQLCKKAVPHSSLSLPARTLAKIENGMLIFTQKKENECPKEFDVPFCEGKTLLSNGVLINVEKNPTEDPCENSVFLDVRCELLEKEAHFRSRKEGDVIFSGKMNKKVKKLLGEKKLSLDVRKRIPMLTSKDEILWIPTVAVCDGLKKDKIKSGESFFRITVAL